MAVDLIDVVTGDWSKYAAVGVGVVGLTGWLKSIFDIRKCSTEIRLIEAQISAQELQNRAATEKLEAERIERQLSAARKRRADLIAKQDKGRKINRRIIAVTPVLALVLFLPSIAYHTVFIAVEAPVNPIEVHPKSALAVEMETLTRNLIQGRTEGGAAAMIDPSAQESLRKLTSDLAYLRDSEFTLEYQGRADGPRLWLDINDEKNHSVASVLFVIEGSKIGKVEILAHQPNHTGAAK